MKRLVLWALCCLTLLFGRPTLARAEDRPVKVASLVFTESVILAEVLTQLAQSTGTPVQHLREMGENIFTWEALRRGEIDAYVNYTGTLSHEIFAGRGFTTSEQIREALAAEGLVMGQPFGFDNTWVLAMRESEAARLGITKISDLTKHPELSMAFTPGFMGRADGWQPLKTRYGLPQADVRGMSHELALRALEGGSLAVSDAYATDAEIISYNLRLLEDDLHFFPPYQGVVVYRREIAQRFPKVAAAWQKLEGHISSDQMRKLNARVLVDHVGDVEVAGTFLAEKFGIATKVEKTEDPLSMVLRCTREHLVLAMLSLLAAIVFAVPFGVLAAKKPRLGQVVLAGAGVVQTIPSLALLVLMIPLLGIGAAPAMAALFLYSLLPIVRNTAVGLSSVPQDLRESAEALGLPARARLFLVELPLASPSILAGIKTAAVINIGNATLGALVGAGGYGQPILTGVRLANNQLILLGAVPAALLALVASGCFEFAERWLVPAGLRLKR